MLAKIELRNEYWGWKKAAIMAAFSRWVKLLRRPD
jgi:hypothetical protein